MSREKRVDRLEPEVWSLTALSKQEAAKIRGGTTTSKETCGDPDVPIG